MRLGFRGQILAYLNIVQMLFILFYVYVIDHGEKSELGFESKKSRKFCLSSYWWRNSGVIFKRKAAQLWFSHMLFSIENYTIYFNFRLVVTRFKKLLYYRKPKIPSIFRNFGSWNGHRYPVSQKFFRIFGFFAPYYCCRSSSDDLYGFLYS